MMADYKKSSSLVGHLCTIVSNLHRHHLLISRAFDQHEFFCFFFFPPPKVLRNTRRLCLATVLRAKPTFAQRPQSSLADAASVRESTLFRRTRGVRYTVKPLNNESPQERNSRGLEIFSDPRRTSIEAHVFYISRQRNVFEKRSRINESSRQRPEIFFRYMNHFVTQKHQNCCGTLI